MSKRETAMCKQETVMCKLLKPSQADLEAGFLLVLKGLGIKTEFPTTRQTTQATAKATTKAWLEHLTIALHQPPPKVNLLASPPNQGAIKLQRIPFHSLCMHHLLPFFGYADIQYLPDQYICSISYLSKVMQHLAKQPTLQEQLIQQVASQLTQALKPKGLKISLRARHMCLQLRDGHPHTFSTFHTEGQWD